MNEALGGVSFVPSLFLPLCSALASYWIVFRKALWNAGVTRHKGEVIRRRKPDISVRDDRGWALSNRLHADQSTWFSVWCSFSCKTISQIEKNEGKRTFFVVSRPSTSSSWLMPFSCSFLVFLFSLQLTTINCEGRSSRFAKIGTGWMKICRNWSHCYRSEEEKSMRRGMMRMRRKGVKENEKEKEVRVLHFLFWFLLSCVVFPFCMCCVVVQKTETDVWIGG